MNNLDKYISRGFIPVEELKEEHPEIKFFMDALQKYFLKQYSQAPFTVDVDKCGIRVLGAFLRNRLGKADLCHAWGDSEYRIERYTDNFKIWHRGSYY